MANWVPLVDALRTLLLSPTSELDEIANHAWFTGRLGMSQATGR